MPALPEIEILRRDLEKEIVGRRIKDAEIRPGSNAMKIVPRHGRRKEFSDLLKEARIESIGRSGRKVYLELDNARLMVIELGDTALLQKTSASEEMAPHTHIVLSFTIGGQLRVIDAKFSTEVFVGDREELVRSGELRTTALDPLESAVAWQEFSSMLQGRDVPLKTALTDDGLIVGLGTLYADEVLFTAGLRHDRQSDQLTSQDVRRLYRALMETLQDAVRARGTTWGEYDFRDLQGNPGQYQLELKVYEREGEPCRRCRSAIVKEDFDSAYVYFCPQCQA